MLLSRTSPPSHAPERLFGLLIGLAIAVSLLGRSLVLPGQAISLVAFIAALAILPFTSIAPSRLGIGLVTTFILVFLYICLIAFSAKESQWVNLLNLGDWSRHAEHYVDSKLTVFAITGLPPIILAVLLTILNHRQIATRYVLLGIIATSALGFIILASSSNELMGTNYGTAADWLSGKGRPAFSTISMGLLLILGALAALCWVGKAPALDKIIAAFVGFCLVATIMLHRRIDTILFVIAIVAILITHARKSSSWKSAVTLMAIIFAIPTVSLPLVANDFTSSYWYHIASGMKYRTNAATIAIDLIQADADESTAEKLGTAKDKTAWLTNKEITSENKEAATANHASVSDDERFNAIFDFGAKILFGYGLGFYADNSADGMMYPHNLIIETFLENGAIASGALLVSIFLPLIPLFAKLRRGTISRYELAFFAIAIVLFTVSLKAGEISSVGHLLFFVILAGATHETSLRDSKNVTPQLPTTHAASTITKHRRQLRPID